jgi:nicotinate-nucleotide adenylyltransferase
MTKSIGIYGGAFDPPHLAHVALAKAAIEQFKFDQLLVIPTGDAVHKRRHLSPGHHRLAMAQLAFADIAQAVVDPREINRGGASYTIDTIMELNAEQPDARLTLIIGQDQLTAFHTWLHYAEILKRVKLAVAMRNGTVMVSPHISFESIEFVPQAISSSDLRQMIRMKDPQFAAKMIPSVAAYIREHELYLGGT